MMREKNYTLSTPVCGALVFTVFLGLSGCGGERQNDEPVLTDATLATALRQVTDNSIVPAVDTFAQASSSMSADIEAFCNDISADSLVQVQDDWRTLAQAWYRVSPYLFGPVNDDVVFPDYLYIDSLRQRGNNYLATVRTDISTMVEGAFDLDGSYFSTKEFNKVGILALEVALFETRSGLTSNDDLLAEYRDEPRKCDVIRGLNNIVAGYSSNMQNEWTTDYQNTGTSYRDLFLAGDTEDGSEPLTLLLTRAQEHLDYLKQRSVSSVAATVSGETWVLMQATLEAVEAIVAGTGSSGVSFYQLMNSAGQSTAVTTVQENFARSYEAIRDKNTTDFNTACALLDGNFKRDIPDALAVQLGINFSDGD